MADSSGIAGSLKEGYAEGPKLRQSKKGVLKKAIPSALLVLIIVLPLLFWWRSGDDAPSTAKTVAPPVTTAPATVPVAPQTAFYAPITIPVALSGEWSEWIRVTGDRCIWIHGVSTSQLQAKEENARDGLDWDLYHEKKKRGEVGNPGWVRMRSDGVMKQITYEFRPPGKCTS